MNILQKIIAGKYEEVEKNKALRPVKYLEESIFFDTPVVSMKDYLRRTDKVGIIAEIKRKAPSSGVLSQKVDVRQLSIGYMQAGATALSILTDGEYFGGSRDDLRIARKYNYCPILRKDFIVDEYQILEARSIGADCILLIAGCLSKDQCRNLADYAKRLGLEVLLEVHSLTELQTFLSQDVDIVGVNNRDLKTFKTDIRRSKELAPKIPGDFVKISESGISDPGAVRELREYGFDGFLIGTHFMKHTSPERACMQFIKEITHPES